MAEPSRSGKPFVHSQSRGVKSAGTTAVCDTVQSAGRASKSLAYTLAWLVPASQRSGGFLARRGWKPHWVGGVRSSTAAMALGHLRRSRPGVMTSTDGVPSGSVRGSPTRSAQDGSRASAWSAKSLVGALVDGHGAVVDVAGLGQAERRRRSGRCRSRRPRGARSRGSVRRSWCAHRRCPRRRRSTACPTPCPGRRGRWATTCRGWRRRRPRDVLADQPAVGGVDAGSVRPQRGVDRRLGSWPFSGVAGAEADEDRWGWSTGRRGRCRPCC